MNAQLATLDPWQREVTAARVALVPATVADQEFAYQVKKAAEGADIAALWGWNESVQRQYQARDWAEKRPDIITCDGKPVGTLYARVEDGALQIRQFFIHPQYQNRGIGSRLLRRVLDRADADNRRAAVAHLVGNRVESLYRRFGFRTVRRENKFCFMEREPCAATGPSPGGGDASKPVQTRSMTAKARHVLPRVLRPKAGRESP